MERDVGHSNVGILEIAKEVINFSKILISNKKAELIKGIKGTKSKAVFIHTGNEAKG